MTTFDRWFDAWLPERVVATLTFEAVAEAAFAAGQLDERKCRCCGGVLADSIMQGLSNTLLETNITRAATAEARVRELERQLEKLPEAILAERHAAAARAAKSVQHNYGYSGAVVADAVIRGRS